MMIIRSCIFSLFASTLLLPVIAIAQSCDAYFPFDGNLADASGNGYNGTMIGKEGLPAVAQFSPGVTGQALRIDGDSAMRAYIDLHPDTCPQVTVSGWLRVERNDLKGTRYLVSTGGGNGPALRSSGRTVTLAGNANGLSKRDALRDSRAWFFFAGVYDYDANTYRFQWRDRVIEGNLKEAHRPPQEALWIGAWDDKLGHTIEGAHFDDIRVTGKALTKEELVRIRGSRVGAVLVSDETETRGPEISENGANGFPTSVMPEGMNNMTADMTEAVQQARDENAPPDITYDSEEEGQAAAAAGAARRAEEASSDAVAASGATTRRSQALEESGPYATGSPGQSSLAGHDGDVTRRLDLVDSFITKIAWEQPKDRPCQIVVGDDGDGFGGAAFGCDAGYGGGIATVPQQNYDSLEREVELNGAAIGRIEVCTSRLNKRLKGIRVWGDHINADGTTTYREDKDSEEFPNCLGNWSPSVHCPIGQMATGLIVYANDLGGDDRAEIVGLRLICRSIGVR